MSPACVAELSMTAWIVWPGVTGRGARPPMVLMVTETPEIEERPLSPRVTTRSPIVPRGLLARTVIVPGVQATTVAEVPPIETLPVAAPKP